MGNAMRTQLLFLVMVLAFSSVLRGATWAPPAANQGAWSSPTDVGVPGGIDQYLVGGVNDRAVTGTVITITDAPYSADNTGVSNVRDAVAAAITAASPGDVIYFPAGTYRFDSGFLYTGYKDNITIRGAGTDLTTFYCSAGNQPIFQCSSPGDINGSEQTVTGTKTKGTATLAISNTTNYTVGRHIRVSYENETDNTRIQAGAAPIWHSIGAPFGRHYVGKITGVVANTSITIDPPLPSDGTNLAVKVGVYPSNSITSGWGFEDFSVSFDPVSTERVTSFIYLNTAEYCWVHNVNFLDWSRTTSNGSCVVVSRSYRCEVRKCVFNATVGSSSDGGIGTGESTSCLYVDNIFSGPWDVTIYDNGNAYNNVIAYNYATGSNGSYFHNLHPSLNLFEGNNFPGHQSDGYHGSSSHNTFFRNLLRGPFYLTLNRFKRNYVIAGNILGIDGEANGQISWGNPNIGNGAANGFAGPTGLSDQEGEIDFLQPGYAPSTYVIQPEDIFAGDFWQDWQVTGTLTTRTSNLVGVFTVSGGHWYVGTVGSGTLLIYARWNNGESFVANGTVTNVSGSDVSITFTTGYPSPALPDEDSTVNLYFGPSGWQERDLDVQASSTMVHNYRANVTSTGAVENSTIDTLPDSLVFASKPAWFGSLAWPPFDPDSPTSDPAAIPAGYRYVNGNEDYLGGVSTPQYSPSPGTYESEQEVTITSATPSVTIYYELGATPETTPTPTTSSTLYTGPVTISATSTLKAIAVKAEMTDSSVQSGTYTISVEEETPIYSVGGPRSMIGTMRR